MERAIERFIDYVKIDSETLNEYDFKERLKKDLEELGLEVHEDKAAGEAVGSNAGNLIAKLKGEGDKTILFSSHMDTVSPGKKIEPYIDEDYILRSKGNTILASDDKAGIAAIMEMLTVLREKNILHHNIEIVFTISEEGGLRGSKNLDYSRINPDFGIVVDSGGSPGHTVIQGPSQIKLDVKFKGKSSHAGVSPEEGVSAIIIAAEAISNMKLLRIDEETTANIGFINGGGPTNIVTDTVEIRAEARSLDEEKLKAQVDHMVKCVKDAQKKYGIEAEIQLREAYKPFKVELDSLPVKRVKAACERLGLKFVPVKSGGGSDTNNYNLHGIPSVNLGIGMEKEHSRDEFCKVEDIINVVKLLVEIARSDV